MRCSFSAFRRRAAPHHTHELLMLFHLHARVNSSHKAPLPPLPSPKRCNQRLLRCMSRRQQRQCEETCILACLPDKDNWIKIRSIRKLTFAIYSYDASEGLFCAYKIKYAAHTIILTFCAAAAAAYIFVTS